MNELIERLRRKVDTGKRTMGGGSVSHDGKAEMWGNHPIYALANPDGPEAADALATLSAKLAEVERERDEAIADKVHYQKMWSSERDYRRKAEDQAHGLAHQLDNSAAWPLGMAVRKKKGSCWSGRIVGYYSTALTPQGIAVESSTEIGSVQIYPITAMEPINNEGANQ